MIPDLLLIPRASWEAQVNGRVTARNRGVLALAVHAYGLLRHAQNLCDAGRVRVRRVARLHRLSEVCVAALRHVCHVDGRLLRPHRQGANERALPLDSHEHAAHAVLKGQVGAAEHAEDNLSILNQGQAHGVLLAPEESLGAVHRVDGPEAGALHRTLGAMVTVVDGIEHPRLVEVLADPNGLHERHDLVLEFLRFGRLQVRRLLFTYDAVVGERGLQHRVDQRLRTEVCGGHG
mmetsp:Transcript_14197/g.36271  ORF Transcript_14197/g.36271 Transcript_14197/m.36271 type:complete len:234 (+) Transcript_14197:343-1044(+)